VKERSEGMKPARSLGNTSLVVAVGGFAAVEAALGQKWVDGPAWGVLGQAFEAATVGGVADWFAVTALFREVPLPVIRRHTNIVVKNRARIVSGIADMVQNRWLSPGIIREHLARFSASRHLLDYLSDEKRTENALSFLRDLVGQIARGIDEPEVSSFLNRVLKDQLAEFDLAGPMGRWIGAAMRRGDHHAVWETVLSALEESAQGEEFREAARKMLSRAIHEYKEGGFLRGIAVELAETLDIVNKDEAVDSLVRNVATGFVEKRHAAIGEMVRGSLEKLSDLDLVSQIEEKVGMDLQYIRLNGAIVGGLVGAALAVGKWLL
jgi:uncharacterized membrane-anchored protein YjiN (DUF445 family)